MTNTHNVLVVPVELFALVLLSAEGMHLFIDNVTELMWAHP